MLESALGPLIERATRRSTGVVEKRRSYRIQLASAVLFGGIAALVASGSVTLGLLFGTEALGQLFLALDERRTLAAGDPVVVYFRRSPLGVAAALVFAGTAAVRYRVAAGVTDDAAWVLALAAALTALHLSPLVWRELRTDAAIGVALTGSALVLGAALLGAGAYGAALGQLAYAGLLVLGMGWLAPWSAELANLAVFSAALAIEVP